MIANLVARGMAVSTPTRPKALKGARFARLFRAFSVAALICSAFVLAVADPSAAQSGRSPVVAPAEPKQQDWKEEIGTSDTEKALDLTPADEAEIQQRLKALGLYEGPLTGALDEPTRFAITTWQKSRGVALSSFLGPLQLAELRAESEDAYLKLLGASAQGGRPAAPAKPFRPAAPVKPYRPPARVAREPAEAPVRHAVRRPSQAPVAIAPAATPVCHANPIWCHRAGLPVAN